jgi:hypothetical protein
VSRIHQIENEEEYDYSLTPLKEFVQGAFAGVFFGTFLAMAELLIAIVLMKLHLRWEGRILALNFLGILNAYWLIPPRNFLSRVFYVTTIFSICGYASVLYLKPDFGFPMLAVSIMAAILATMLYARRERRIIQASQFKSRSS